MADPIAPGFNFELTLGQSTLRASKVQNIIMEVPVEAYQEGGVNDHVHTLVCQAKELKTLVVERGYCSSDTQGNLEGKLGILQTDPLKIHIYGLDGKYLKCYEATGITVTKIRMSDLDAASSVVLFQTIEMTYHKLMPKPQ